LLIAVIAVVATSFDELDTAPRADRSATVRLAQTGPLPTSIVNPRLGQPPNDSRLGPNGPTNFGPSTLVPIGPGTTVGPAVVPNDGVGSVPPTDPSGRLGPMSGANRLGVPPPGTAANPATGVVPGGAAVSPGAVAPPAGTNVGPAPAAPAVGR
jgi:hypothetical protein